MGNSFLNGNPMVKNADGTFSVATGVDLTIAGIGAILLPEGVGQSASSDTNTAILGGANQVKVQQFVLPVSVNVGHFSFTITTASAGGHCDVGIYDYNGNLLLHAGSISTTATGNINVVLSPKVALVAGTYYLAWTADNIVMQFNGIANGQQHQSLLNLNGTRSGQAANAATAGVLPATLGVITNAALNSVVAVIEP